MFSLSKHTWDYDAVSLQVLISRAISYHNNKLLRINISLFYLHSQSAHCLYAYCLHQLIISAYILHNRALVCPLDGTGEIHAQSVDHRTVYCAACTILWVH